MLSVDGDADAAVETRIRIGWNKFRQLGYPSLGLKALTQCLCWIFVRYIHQFSIAQMI